MSGEVYIVESKLIAGPRDRKVQAVFGSYKAARDWIEAKGCRLSFAQPWDMWQDGVEVALFKSIDTRPEYSDVQFVVSRWMIHD